MDGRIVSTPNLDGGRRVAVGPWLGSVVAATALGLVLVITAVLLVRRLSGVPWQPLHPVVMLAVALAVTALAAVIRLVWTAEQGGPSSGRVARGRFAVPSFILLALGVTLWLPSTDGWSVAAYWSVVVAGEIACWLPLVRARYPSPTPRVAAGAGTRNRSSTQVPGPVGGDLEDASHVNRVLQDGRLEDGRLEDGRLEDGSLEDGSLEGDELEEEDHELEDEPQWPPGLTQQLTRTRSDDGSELVYGVLRGEFASGERQQTLHLAFTPPLPSLPRASAHQVEGPDAQIKVADCQTYGVRLDLRLARAAPRRESVLLELEVTCDAADDDLR